MKGLFMKYFVLKPSTKDIYGLASLKAIRSYAVDILKENPKFASDLLEWIGYIEKDKR